MTVEETPKRVRRRWPLWVGIGIGALLLTAGSIAGYRHYQRHILANFRTVVEGQVYRSGLPTPDQLREWKETRGIQAVVCLRSPRDEEYPAERKASEELGMKLHVMDWYSAEATPVAKVRWLIAALDASERPVLIHCSAGVDRSGVASAIAAMKLGGVDYETASRQLDPLRRSQPESAGGTMGVLLQYEEHCRGRGRGTGGWAEFSEWLSRLP